MDKRIIAMIVVLLVLAGAVVAVRFAGRDESPPPLSGTEEPIVEEENGDEPEDKSGLIRVDSPARGATLTNPVVITGEARGGWYFEADFPIRLYDTDGQLLATAIATAQGDWMTADFVPFRAELEFPVDMSRDAVLVFERDNPSGLPENADQLIWPVRLEAGEETMVVKAYFSNSRLDPEVSCTQVFPVNRTVAKTSAVARAALNELLKGVLPSEAQQQYATNINSGVAIQSLTISDGVARVDFSRRLEEGVGGSCWVAVITTQIRETLLQFPTVQEVVISIDGRTEDILQP